ncbi:hypothetical protein H8356DRAFT_1330334 [Neocallimastix lanati (nom. inval.)]|nr:hypothetical protein H8356DRAFT_1330334 [Neocallimastix sp. JGI-2020a]
MLVTQQHMGLYAHSLLRELGTEKAFREKSCNNMYGCPVGTISACAIAHGSVVTTLIFPCLEGGIGRVSQSQVSPANRHSLLPQDHGNYYIKF